MFEETISVVSMWAAMNSWLTPAVLFVVLNVMIGTIAVTSGLGASPKHPHNSTQNQDPTRQQSPSYSPGPLNRSPSVLQRPNSINFYRSDKEPAHNNPLHYSADPIVPTDTDPITLLARFETHMEGNAVHADETPKEKEEQEVGVGEEGREANAPSLDGVFSRIHEEKKRVFGRSKSEKKTGGGGDAVLAAEKKLPRWVKKSGSVKAASSHFEVDAAADEEVDAKADDFINKFRQQLQLQRM